MPVIRKTRRISQVQVSPKLEAMTMLPRAPVLYAKKPEVMAAGVPSALVFGLGRGKIRKNPIPRIVTRLTIARRLHAEYADDPEDPEDSNMIEPEIKC
jgi:hypothetical protein